MYLDFQPFIKAGDRTVGREAQDKAQLFGQRPYVVVVWIEHLVLLMVVPQVPANGTFDLLPTSPIDGGLGGEYVERFDVFQHMSGYFRIRFQLLDQPIGGPVSP